jgi:hypothetical protein
LKGLYLPEVSGVISECADKDKEGILPSEGELAMVTGEEKGIATEPEFGVEAGMRWVAGDMAVHRGLATYGHGMLFGDLEAAEWCRVEWRLTAGPECNAGQWVNEIGMRGVSMQSGMGVLFYLPLFF